jgi:hypothetical protein
MISVVCVFHKRDMLDRVLMESLMKQPAHQLILMDNTLGQWKSAASALNAGAKLATGKYIMFVHQDVELGTPTYLRDIERTLDGIPNLGIAGAIGMSEQGRTYQERLRGHVSNCGEGWGNVINKPEPCQTLDELLLVVPRGGFQGFDEKTFDHWHCYGVDYALTMNEQGKGVYALPGFVYHRSLATNVENLRTYHKRLFYKHHKHFSRIHATTNGLTWVSILTLPELMLAIRINHWLFPNWIERAKKEVQGCQTLLDLGCGYNSPVQYFNVPEKTGVEIHAPYLTESQKKGVHQHYHQGDIMDMRFPLRSFDVVFCSEVLEHLAYHDGLELLRRMDGWAAKKVIITTPNGYVHQEAYDGNRYQAHRSIWFPRDFRRQGYKVSGMSGLKWIRGEQGQCVVKPEVLGMRLASISYRITRYMPELDFQVLAVKDVARARRG